MTTKELTGAAPGRRPAQPPMTPLHKAAQAGVDNRFIHHAKNSRNWRVAFFLTLGALLIAVGALAKVATAPAPAPMVVTVDPKQGTAVALGRMGEQNYQPGVNEKRAAIAEWIKQVRSLPLDPVVLRDNWTHANAYMTAMAGQKLNQWAQSDDAPTHQVGDKTISVQIVSVLPISPTSFEARWVETTYNSGGTQQGAPASWAATVTLTIIPPASDGEAMVNPLGIRIKDFAWHRDMATASGQ